MKKSNSNISVPWGRGASEHRPGLFIKNYLQQQSSAPCADVFAALRDSLDQLNRFRIEIGEKPIRGCIYNSFAKYWHWFKLLGLIEPTEEVQPAAYIFLKEKRFYRLTSQGLSETDAWLDPIKVTHPEFR